MLLLDLHVSYILAKRVVFLRLIESDRHFQIIFEGGWNISCVLRVPHIFLKVKDYQVLYEYFYPIILASDLESVFIHTFGRIDLFLFPWAMNFDTEKLYIRLRH